MKKIIMKESQFNNLITELNFGCENLNTFGFDLFVMGNNYNSLNESIGVPNFINGLTSEILNLLKQSLENKENELNISLTNELSGWTVNIILGKDIVGVTYKETNEIIIGVNKYKPFDDSFYSNIIGHELMHAYQISLVNRKTLLNKDLYEKMNTLFNNFEEWHPLCILNYIIYYSFIEEQEAYTVGGKEYFDNINIQHDMENNDYVSILKNSPYHIVFNRLGRARTILMNREYYVKEINQFCDYYNINENELLNILDNEIKTFKYKFSRIINNFCMKNNISMKDRKKFYF